VGDPNRSVRPFDAEGVGDGRSSEDTPKGKSGSSEGAAPAPISVLAPKELLVIVPVVPMFLNIEMLLLSGLVTTRSGLPSPSRSLILIFAVPAESVGPVLVKRLAGAAKEIALVVP